MKLDINEDKFIFQPTQIIEVENNIVLKRGINQLIISGELAVDVINTISTLASEDGATKNEILEYFGADAEQISEVLNQLIEKGFLINIEQKNNYDFGITENRLDIYYESIGSTKKDVESLLEKKIAIIGVNTISRQLARTLNESGVTNYQIVDNTMFRNISLFNQRGEMEIDKWGSDLKIPVKYTQWVDSLAEESIDLLVCTSDFGGMQMMRDFNSFCVENNILFLPIILQDFKGYIGPLVMPGETACFECLLSRQNSILTDFEVKRTIELSAHQGQDVIGFHPAMSSVLGNIAAMEIVKFFTKALQTWNLGYLIEVNLLKTETKTRKILKIPRCPVCSEMNHLSKITVSVSTFTPTNEE